MTTLLQTLLSLAVLAPLASFALLVFARALVARLRVPFELIAHVSADDEPHGAGTRHGHHRDAADPISGWVASAAISLSLMLSLIVLVVWSAASDETRARVAREAAAGLFTWLSVGGLHVPLSLQIDSLTIIMFVMVTICAACIHVFSIGYMQGDARFGRYFAFLSLFCFSMLGLVVSGNLLVTFVFWELVGLSSYLLIGFWHERPAARAAAMKAFIVNRVGDAGFLIGLALCVAYLGTLSLSDAPAVFVAAADRAGLIAPASGGAALAAVGPEQLRQAATLFQSSWLGVSLATWLGLALFCGAVGKSAQAPLHVWLPDAMEGPTPVSALIHAATMVAAGIYLLARVFPLLTPAALGIIAVVGCITLTGAALLALVQTDIKRVLAYSTLSQLGYMVFAIGIGAWVAALFHLLTHAFFKALLFLGAGQVIAGCHHEQDIRSFGGLRQRMPRTALTFGLAVLAISGAGVPWLGLGIGGYYSKDEILAVALGRWCAGGEHATVLGALPGWLVALPMIVAWVTPLYMGRVYVLTFLGRPRNAPLHATAREHAALVAPLLILAAFTLLSGWLLFRSFVAHAAPNGALLAPPIDGHAEWLHGAHRLLPLLVGFAWVGGLGAAWFIYKDGLAFAERIARLPLIRLVHALLLRRFFIDELYAFAVVSLTRLAACICRVFDEWVVDGVVGNIAYMLERSAAFCAVVLDARGVDGAANGVGTGFWTAGSMFSAMQTGRVRHYVLLALAALTSILVYLLTGRDLGWAGLFLLVVGGAILLPWAELMRQVGIPASRPGVGERR